ncbi:MAG TPA: glycine cleavage system protein GcvH [Actinomycetota bacterium]|nr:glycine cleavage system protein GcvH [Actinomycetota bacterium]
MEYPSDLRYTSEHEWAAPEEGGRVRVGVTDFAQDALGDVVYVDLPAVGADLRAGETFGEVESTKSVSDLFSPVSGRVVERNEQLEDAPELVNQDPYGEGWMIVIEMEDASDLDELMDAEAYRRTVEEGGEG